MKGQDKNNRILDIYMRLCDGKVLNKAEEALRFRVDERSIQRDFKDIRKFLEARRVSGLSECDIFYDRTCNGFRMTGLENTLMSNSEILAVSKILLESRAFTKEEVVKILDKLVSGCVRRKDMKLVADLLANEKFHYVEIHHEPYIEDKLWDIGSDIEQSNLLKITYQKQAMEEEPVERVIQPLAILFSEYYFYLNAYIVEENDKGEYVQKYDYPAVFRIDRIKDYSQIGRKFKIPYRNRFEEGEFRKRIQFMYMGRLIKLQFRYTGKSIASILERLPTARILEESQEGYVLEAEVYGRGVLMWLMTQGSMVEVLRPDSARAEMKRLLSEMLAKYE